MHNDSRTFSITQIKSISKWKPERNTCLKNDIGDAKPKDTCSDTMISCQIPIPEPAYWLIQITDPILLTNTFTIIVFLKATTNPVYLCTAHEQLSVGSIEK